MRVGGHRGNPARFPDNTLSGIRSAAALVDFVEIDVRSSADGKRVLSHDPVMGGLTIFHSKWEEIKGLDVGDGLRPALLEEVMELSVPLNIEIKNWPGDPDFDETHQFAISVSEAARPGDFVTSFFWPTVDAIREALPDVSTGLLVDHDASIPLAINRAVAQGHLTIAVHKELALADRKSVEDARDAGLDVICWTVNDPDRAVELDSLGVHSIITDDPEAMKAVLGGQS